MKKIFSKKEITKVEVGAFKELTDEQLNKIVGGDSRIRMGFDFSKLFGK
ncbi:ComC/BlpC family leader-containing pheromone/bacteriocin [Streptococcus constellatus subsp. pharyngis]|uniref:COMC family protein n=1 Tax=Streptococcus constellatus subsp. pharyngis SK1060 = CCUG 46377 TaxID=1035184 RepID=F9P9F4_STRCV|nr:ComC/BlpC family leader-containing pheromone/bacteriocin [Streptococcus constellatus]AGU73661.1 competence stimulating peptide precursor [Streptococcus constellatus subsp. pharyngis C232]AGU75415.1 competence stimulating peptide precursor [Streptococcus constellatus subsp. pharyngis C818]AGU80805.1 competence stimulating peptide precursor [Streptococcus constellatus subsp. pharyngis C1050]EGV07548.1 COMC family protein [Streptococcus constellatus subsp. pharyngis SK1060 = CCUG 46377]QQC2240